MSKIPLLAFTLLAIAGMQGCQDAGKQTPPSTASASASVPVVQSPAVVPAPVPSPPPAPITSATKPTQPASRPVTASKPASTANKWVKVPLLQGCDLRYEQKLLRAGLKPKPIAVHGPEPDAAGLETGCPYRVQPKPGTQVAPGSVVTYRAWWEQGDSQ